MGLGNWLRRHTLERFVQDVPPELYGCELCGEADCTQARFASCEFRVHSEFLERKHHLDIANKPKSLSQASEDEIDSFEVVPLSPGILPVAAGGIHTKSDPEDTADSPARSGFRPALRQDRGESEAHSVTIKRVESDASPQTRRSARHT
jgi:hypothetical protein